jgi:hypothetical protein
MGDMLNVIKGNAVLKNVIICRLPEICIYCPF